MLVRAIDDAGDWRFGKGKNDYLTANAAVAQSIQTRLRSFLGDCFFAIDAGLDWFNLLGSKNQLALELSVRAVILNTENVVGIRDATILLDPDSRRISMRYSVDTVYTVINNTGPVFDNSHFLLTEDGDILTTEDGLRLDLG